MKKILVVFGGRSSEHEISCVSASNVIEHINKEKYQVFTVGIDKQGNWIEYTGDVNKIKENTWLKFEKNKVINNVFEYIKKYDVCFSVLHGKYGEDGSIQGLFEMAQVRYVGCDIITSAISIEKSITKRIVESINIPVVTYLSISKKDYNKNIDIIDIDVKKRIKYPLIVKPCKEGSSFGVNKVNNKDELDSAIEFAFKYDKNILLEKYISAREIECAVLGNDKYIVSDVGEIVSEKELYDFDSKYNSNISKTIVNVNIDEKIKNRIREYASNIANILQVRGLSRIDFFVEKNTNNIYFNEINTMPGFTSISMYPKLMQNIGIEYTQLIDKLIELAME